MQFTTLVLSGFLSLAVAQSSDVSSLISELPSCGQTCLVNGAAAANCEATDYSCQCDNQDAIIANSTSCILSACSVSDISTTQQISTQICEAVSGNSTTTSDNSTSTATSTGTSTSASASSTSTTGSSAGSQLQLAGFGWAAVVGVVGYLAL